MWHKHALPVVVIFSLMKVASFHQKFGTNTLPWPSVALLSHIMKPLFFFFFLTLLTSAMLKPDFWPESYIIYRRSEQWGRYTCTPLLNLWGWPYEFIQPQSIIKLVVAPFHNCFVSHDAGHSHSWLLWKLGPWNEDLKAITEGLAPISKGRLFCN